jgi:hypothetical protein
MAKSKVAVLKVTPETVLTGIARACELGGMRAALVGDRATVLQDDLSWRFPFPAANTTPWQLEGAILALRAAGFEELACVRGETAMARALEWADPSFGGPVCDAHGVPLLRTFKDDEVRWALYRPKARMHVLGKVFPDGIHVPDVFFGKNAVQLPTMKTHVYTTIAGAMKCAFGGTLPRDRHRAHRAGSSIHKALVDVQAIQREIHTGLFAVMDGTTAGSGPGPRTMTPVVKDYVLAGADPVALDAVAAKMMGFDPMALEFIRLAHEDRLGVGDPRDIDVVGDDAAATDEARRESWGFQVGSNGASVIGDALWSGPLRRFERLFFGAPFRGALAAGNEAYHDLYRWPLKDRRTFESWKRETAWGRLFAAYERGEADRVTRRVSPAVSAHKSASQAHV